MKINIFQWRYSPFLLLGFGLFGAESAHAVIQCSNPSMSALTFADVDSQSTQTDATATFSITCRNSLALTTRGATVCVSIGPDRQMTSGLSKLDFQLYQDSNRSIIWGSQFEGPVTPYKFNVSLGIGATDTFYATLYGRVLAGQTGVTPGAYTKTYPKNDNARVTVNAPVDNDPPGTCNTNPSGSLYIPFTVTVPMIKSCQVTTASDVNLGSKSADKIGILGNSNIGVTCTKTTPYNIGLAPMTPNPSDNTNGGGWLNGTGGNTNQVPYQLFSDAARTKKWGNNGSTFATLINGVTGTGSGAEQSHTVYVTVPSADFKPDSYSDTVTINVNY